MFSGIIEGMGKIVSLMRTGSGAVLDLETNALTKKVKPGDSVAVNGVCLTVTRKTGRRLQFDVSAETWKRTNLSSYTKDHHLNLELSVTPQSMLSGHFVQGHVEGLGRVKKWIRKGEDVRLFVELPADLIPACVTKGSIALNGVSLTIASQKGRTISVALIPYTLSHTNLNELEPGDSVNVETDIIGRYVVSTLKKTYDNH
jgi:riboflavin synthase alpha subunit